MKKLLVSLSLVLAVLVMLSGCIVLPAASTAPSPSSTPPPVASLTAPPAAPSPSAAPSESAPPSTSIVESPVLSYSQASAAQVTAVEALVAARQQAIQKADVAALLATVTPDDPWYMQEQKNLARALAQNPVQSFAMKVSNVMAAENGELKATVSQSYSSGGKKRSCSYTERFVSKNGAYLDAGLSCLMLENGLVRVSYPDASFKDIARQSITIVTDHLSQLSSRFGFTPTQKVSVRYFTDAEIFTESIKLHLPTYNGGWNEYGESLKLTMDSQDIDYYSWILRHESTHHFLSNMTNDNACYWMQEGLATMLEQGIQGLDDLRVGRAQSLVEMQKAGHLPDFKWLNETNPESIMDDGSMDAYYAASSLAISWFIDTYGFDKLKKVYDILRSDPYIEGTAAEKIPQLSERTIAAMEQATGSTRTAFEAGFNKDIKDYVASLND